MTTYYFKREWDEYKLLISKDTGNLMDDVGHWTPRLSDKNFSNFYYSLLDEIFPEIGKDDTLAYDTTISPMERDHISPVFNFYQNINSARGTLIQVFDESGEIIADLVEEYEEGMGMPPDIVLGLQEKIESAIEELSFD